MSSFGYQQGRRNRRTQHSTKKKRKQRVQSYSFPILANEEIINCLDELEIQDCTEDKLIKPKPGFVKEVYETLAEYCMGTTREEMNQQSFAGLAMRDLLQNPELHENSIPVLTFYRCISKLMAASQIDDFSILNDLIRPRGERFIRNLSAIINFAKFREERMEAHTKLTARRAELGEEKERLLEEQHQLQLDIDAARAACQKDQEAINEAQVRNTTMEADIDGKKHAYESLKNEVRELKKRLASTKGYEQESQYKMLEAQEECDKLEQQIVNSPERIRGELRTMEEDLRRCRTEATREEQRTAGIAHRTTEVEKAIKNISKCNAAMDTAIAEMTRYKDAKKELRETQSTIRTGEAELRECEARRNLAQRQIANLEEKLKKTQRMRRTKEAASRQCLEQANSEFEEMLRSRNNASVEENRMREQIEQLKRQRERHVANFESTCRDVEVTYARLSKSVSGYHQRMFGVAVENLAAPPAPEAASRSPVLRPPLV